MALCSVGFVVSPSVWYCRHSTAVVCVVRGIFLFWTAVVSERGIVLCGTALSLLPAPPPPPPSLSLSLSLSLDE